MMSFWHSIGAVAGTGALAYLAAGRQSDSRHSTLRLSLDREHSLLTDVRLLGGALVGAASFYVKDPGARSTMRLVALGSFASLLTTEIVRYRLNRGGLRLAKLPVFPSAVSRWSETTSSPSQQRA